MNKITTVFLCAFLSSIPLLGQVSATDPCETTLFSKSNIKDSFLIGLFAPPPPHFIMTQELVDLRYKVDLHGETTTES